MNKKTKLTVAAIGLIVLLGGGFVVADYLALFGTSTTTKLAFAEARFRTLDKDTGDLIIGARVRCFQRRNNNACTLRDSHQHGVVAVHVPYKRIVESTLLFTKTETIEKAADPRINIMFIHTEYMKETLSLQLDDIFNQPGKEYTVKMKRPGITDASAEQES